MKYSREYIIKHAFDVFMNRGYDSASISVLQAELHMSRGALYRYFKNKEELFISVIDEYFFRIFNRLTLNQENDYTLKQLIEITHRRQKLLINTFTKAGFTQTIFLNYTALLIQAAKHYPNFIHRYRVINGRLLRNWKMAIERSIEIKEIKSDIDIKIIAYLFNNVSVKESYDPNNEETTFSNNIIYDVEIRKRIMDYLFSLIKL